MAIASDRYIARGMLRRGFLISPPMAGMRSKPWAAMKVNPEAAISPVKPPSKNGSRARVMCSTGSVNRAMTPARMITAKTTTLPMVAHWPPPAPLRTRLSA